MIFNWRNESVSTAMQGFNEPGILRLVSQRFALLLNGAVQAVIKINECVRRPKLLTQVLAGYDLSRSFQQNRQHLEGLFLQLDSDPALVEFALLQINFKDSKADDTRNLGKWHRDLDESTIASTF